MSLRDKRILLTGATGGIGRHVALELARAGARLALVGRDAEALRSLARTVDALGPESVPLRFDLASPSGHAALVDHAAAKLGGLDVLVNNAGVQRFCALADEDEAAIANLIAINITSPLLLARAAVRHFLQHGSGHLVNVGSTFGAIGYPHFASYSASKFALRGFSEALRRELGDAGVRVSYVSPRATATTMNTRAVREMQARTGTRVDDPATVAKTIVAAIAEGPAEKQLGWPERLFVRINALLPRLVDRALAPQARVALECARSYPAQPKHP
ncbi:MAG: SDR family oxidoreductase [Burkholderiales bacterium]